MVNIAANMARVATLDAVLAASTCSLPALVKVNVHHRPPGSLNGRRDLHSGHLGAPDGESDPACPCNSTYISVQCCESESDLVWEDPALKLGRVL
jgi:hypothetical protein